MKTQFVAAMAIASLCHAANNEILTSPPPPSSSSHSSSSSLSASVSGSADETSHVTDQATTTATSGSETEAPGSTCADGFVSAGGVRVDAGGVDVKSGGIQVVSGGVQVESGGLQVRDGGAVYQSTAGFALEVVGKSAVRSTAEQAPALSVGTTSRHFQDVLLELHTDTHEPDESYSFITARNGNHDVDGDDDASINGTEPSLLFHVDGGGNVFTNGTVHSANSAGSSYLAGSVYVGGNFTVGAPPGTPRTAAGAPKNPTTSVRLAGQLGVDGRADFGSGLDIRSGGVTMHSSLGSSGSAEDSSSSDDSPTAGASAQKAIPNVLSIDDHGLGPDSSGVVKFRRGKGINGTLYSAASNDVLGAIEFAAFDDDPGRTEYRTLASVSARMRAGGHGHLLLATGRKGTGLTTAMEIDASQAVTFTSNATAAGVLATRSRLDSTGHTTGALTSRGGLGVAKNVHIGGRVTIENSAAPRMLSAADGTLQPSPPALIVRGDASVTGTLQSAQGLHVRGLVPPRSNGAKPGVGSAEESPSALLVEGEAVISGSLALGGNLALESDTNSHGLGSGSIVTHGGLSVGGDTHFGGMHVVRGETLLQNDASVAGQLHVTSNADVSVQSLDQDSATSVRQGALVVDGGAVVGRQLHVVGQVHIADTTNSDDSTSGAFVTQGGLGVGMDIHAGGRVVVADELVVRGRIHALGGMAYAPDGTGEADGATNFLSSSGATLHTGGSLVVSSAVENEDEEESGPGGALGGAVRLEVRGSTELAAGLHVSGGNVSIEDDAAIVRLAGSKSQLDVRSLTDSINATTGAVVVGGGVAVGRNLTVGGRIIVGDDTQSRSVETGSVVTPGGVGVGGNLNIGGDVNLYGTLYGWSGLTGIFPDYVFDEEYPLRSIPELAEYVKEHRHLPGVPSAAEVAEEGRVDLVELNRVLLEKLEEMSLYIIQLERSAAERANQFKLMDDRLRRLEEGAAAKR